MTGSQNNNIGNQAGYAVLGNHNNNLGYQAGYNVGGYYNNNLGFQTGSNNTLGEYNNNLGYQAGKDATGSNNNSLGNTAGRYVTGNYNNILGSQAGFYLQSNNNNVFGNQAGFNTTTGQGNNFYGYRAGYLNISGSYIVNIGHQAGYSNTASDYSVNLGYQAGFYLTGSSGINIGYQAGKGSASGFLGSYNNLFGYQSGTNLASGANNNAFGYRSGFFLTSGGNNNFMGRESGYSITSQNYVIAIGYQAAYSNAYDNIAAIGQSAEADATDQFTISNTYTTAKLRNYKFDIDQDTTGLKNYVLAKDPTDGLIRLKQVVIPIDTVPDHDWHTSTGATPWSINDNIHTKGKIAINDGYKSVWIGVDSAGYNSTSTGLHNLAILDSAGWNNTTGYSNHFIGNKAGYSNTTGFKNIYFGNGVGTLIDDGKYNVLIGDSVATKAAGQLEGNAILGYGAAARATGLYDNVIIGLDAAFFTSDTVVLNTIIGPFAATNMSGDNNVLIGHYAGQYTGGNNNVFVGTYAGSAQVGGSQTGTANVAIGESAGEELSTGNYNVYVGSEAGSDATTGSNNVLIGRQAGNTVTGSYNVMIGNAVGTAATTGTHNLFLGSQSGQNNAGGNKNVFSGYLSGNLNTTGSSNVFIGENAGDYNLTGSNNIVVGTFAGSFAEFTARDWELFIGQGNDTTATIWGELNPAGVRTLSFNTDSVRLWEYPNTRDDGTIANVLGTSSNGVIQSYLLDTLIAVVDRNITHPAYMSSFWWDSGNDGGVGTEITDGETIQVTGSNGITATRSGNNMIIDGSGTYYAWNLNVNGSFRDGITDLETVGFTAGTGISLSYDGTNLTITNTASSSYSSWAVWVNGSLVDDIIDGEYLNFTGGTGISVSYSGGTTINITNTGDVSSTNELQTLTSSGTTSFTSTLSSSGGSFTLSAGTGISISRSGNTATITASGAAGDQVWDYSGGDATSTTQNVFRSGAVSIGAINDDFVDGGTSEPLFHVYSSSGSRTVNSTFYNAASTMRINLQNLYYTNYIQTGTSNGDMLLYSNGGFEVTAFDDILISTTTTYDSYIGNTNANITLYGVSGSYDAIIAASGDIILSSSNVGAGRTPTSNRLEVEGNASKTTAGSWLANSDRRIKQDIHAVAHPYETIELLNPVTFRYTDQWLEMNPSIKDQVYYNYIAQDFRNVFPEAVKGSGEYLPGDSEEILQIDDHAANIVTVAAVKQLIGDYKGLQKRIEELENKLKEQSKK